MQRMGVSEVSSLKDIFSIYIIIFLLGIGLYMTTLQSVYLKNVDHLDKEAIFTKAMGIFYLIVAMFGIFIRIKA